MQQNFHLYALSKNTPSKSYLRDVSRKLEKKEFFEGGLEILNYQNEHVHEGEVDLEVIMEGFHAGHLKLSCNTAYQKGLSSKQEQNEFKIGPFSIVEELLIFRRFNLFSIDDWNADTILELKSPKHEQTYSHVLLALCQVTDAFYGFGGIEEGRFSYNSLSLEKKSFHLNEVNLFSKQLISDFGPTFETVLSKAIGKARDDGQRAKVIRHDDGRISTYLIDLEQERMQSLK